MQANPTLYFPGRCGEALAFYRDAIGADILFHHRVDDIIDPRLITPGTGHRTLRAAMAIGGSRFYLADGHGSEIAFQGVSLALVCDTPEHARRTLEALAEGGTVRIPLRPTAWAEAYGAVLDRFGLYWTVEAGVRHGMT